MAEMCQFLEDKLDVPLAERTAQHLACAPE